MLNVPSRRTLVLDGSLGFCLVAIVEQRAEVATCTDEDLNDEQPLLQRINSMLPSRADRAALTDVVVGAGPGSYTGTRAAASTAAGIAAALALPLRQSPSDRALWHALQRPFSIALGTRESLEVSASGSLVVARELASPHVTREECRSVVACALVHQAGPDVSHVTLRYPAPPRGSEVS